jgi:hypothetical protein
MSERIGRPQKQDCLCFLQTFFFFFYQKDLDNNPKKWIIVRFQVLCTLNKTTSSYTECLCNTSSFSRSLSSCGIRNQGFKRARIWWKSEHKTHTQVKAYSSPKLLLIIYFPKGQEFLPFDKKMQNSQKSKSPSNTPRKKEAKKKSSFFFSLFLAQRILLSFFL